MECDGCTLCCKLLNIPWMDSPAGEYCRECEPGVGCKIYDNAPKDCLDFYCAYNQVEKVSKNLRPDKCGVIFERFDDIMFGTIDPEKNQLSKDIVGQIEFFILEGFSIVLVMKGNVQYIHAAEGYTEQELIDKLNDST